MKLRGVMGALRRPRVEDRLIVAFNLAVYLPVAVADLSKEHSAPVVLAACGLVAVRSLPLLVRRSRPALALAGAVAGDAVAVFALGWSDESPSLTTLFALYSTARYLPYARGWAVGGPVVVAIAINAWWIETVDAPGGITLLCAMTVGIGQFVRFRAETAEQLRRDRARAAVQAERRRIARELHDVVAHHISVMNVLVGAARTTMTLDPVRAQEALSTTEQTGREAMSEMRRLLSVLRADDEPDAMGPVARTAQLPQLVERTRSAGTPAELEISGPPRPLPAAVDLTVYRIVQEALTNAHKHAFGARTRVRLRYEDAAIDVEVLDDGPGAAPRNAADEGYGLRGMAERVALCDGELRAGPRDGRGFRVHARIPLPAVREPA